MHYMHEYLTTAPFDLYELHLFHLVAKQGSFTKAAEVAGLTQSAITRQIQGMENSLGAFSRGRTWASFAPDAATANHPCHAQVRGRLHIDRAGR